MVIHFGFLVTMLLSSKLSEYIGGFWILLFVGLIFCAIGFGGMLKYKKGKFVGAHEHMST